MKTITGIIYAAFALLPAVVLLPHIGAVVPPPDGAYPNFTTAEGQSALQGLTTGAGNTALGAYSLFSTSTASFNTAVGAGALDLNTGDSNTAVGVAALLLNTGAQNTAVGVDALGLNIGGQSNAAMGAFALYNNSDGSDNTAVGSGALEGNTTGNSNTAAGSQALQSNTTGEFSTAFGFQALQNNNTDAGTAVGAFALRSNTSGVDNTAMGAGALEHNSVASGNTAVGASALLNTVNGGANTGYGFQALSQNTGGGNNTAIGANAGHDQTTGSNNVYVGAGMTGVAGESDSCYIASIFGQTSVSGTPVFINFQHRLGTATSSKRFKDDIKPMDKASETIFALNPVTFRYKKNVDPDGTPQFGLVAEDVERVNPGLVVRDKEGQPYTVRYEAVNAMLLNEFLKEHRAFIEEQRKVEKLQATVAQQQKDFEATLADLKRQIQRVSAQIELKTPVPRTVLNNR